MKSTLILGPVLVQIMLTIILFLILGVRKTKAIKAGAVDRAKAALDNGAWPDDVRQVSNNIQNQFQVPVLFYALTLAFLVLDSVSMAILALSWTFAVSRLIHAYVHIHSNYVPLRFRLFLLGFVMIMALAVILAVQVASPQV
jgi:hypothetical protein